MNIKNCYAHNLIKDITEMDLYYDKLIKIVSSTSLQDLELKFYPHITESKELLKKTLIKVFESRSFEDLSSELNGLQLLANNVAKISIDPIDLESLLLIGLIINDQSLTFQSKEAEEFSPLFSDDESIKNHILNYSKNILQNIYINENQIIIWVFEIENNVFCLSINHKKEYHLKPLLKWKLSSMRSWLSKISDFYYYNKKGGFFINEQEVEYIKILKDTNFAIIEDLPTDKEILIYTSLELSIFPHNLIQASYGENTIKISEHEEIVQEYVKANPDFVSFNTSVSNIISIDWFAKNGKEIRLKNADLKIEAWIPTIDEDTNIYIGYDKLVPIIEMQYNGTIHTGIYPEQEINSLVNVFLAHGGKGIEGFKTLYTRNFEGRAITKDHGVKKVFGKGLIAVLFVCNSASISKEVYSQKLISFTNTILALGYKAVIAPAWSLCTDIPAVWLKPFLKALTSGSSLGQAVHNANLSVAKNGYDDCYYTPTGWAAMHLYGNPNIYFENDK